MFPSSNSEKDPTEDFDEAFEQATHRNTQIGTTNVGKPHKGRSLSFSVPVRREAYRSLPESPATLFLSQFTAKDDAFTPELFKERTVIKNYVIGKLIGRGNFSSCREAYAEPEESLGRTKQLPEKVVLKIVTDPRVFISFENEISIWRDLHHPHILPLLDWFSGECYRVAVTALCENGDLLAFSKKRGPHTEDEIRLLFLQLTSAVSYLHIEKRLVHRDIKLENIFVNKNGNLFLGDFGLATAFEDVVQTWEEENLSSESFRGAFLYACPEALSDTPNLNCVGSNEVFEFYQKQDIWCLGIVLYALCVGRLPFVDEYWPRLKFAIENCRYQKLPSCFSPELQELVDSMVQKENSLRPSISEVLKSKWFNVTKESLNL